MPKIKDQIELHKATVRARQLFNNKYVRQRELGMKFPLGYTDQFYKTLYTSVQPTTSWDHNDSIKSANHGGIFNLDYSPDGSLLLAACEKKSVLMFDPLCRKLIHSIDHAHDDCVNGARFLDQRMFATCSDDSTAALWDARNLKYKIRSLQGHTNWVKNIEYSPKDKLLLTSGFDGIIFTWDINSFTENSCVSTRVFQTNGLMRTILSPDSTKMLMCTTSGYLILVHNVDLNTLNQDLAGFKPNVYRLMQLSQTTIPVAACFTHLFSSSRTRNRIEFITDFPQGNDAEVISSLQIHPYGWCALSRNVSSVEKSEWTCIHDIQERGSDSESDQQQNQSPKDNPDLSGSSSSNLLNDFTVEEFDEDQPQRPSRSGITTSDIVIGNMIRARIAQRISDQSSGGNSSFESSDAYEPNQPSRTSNWQEQPLRRSLRISNSGARSRPSNYDVVFGEYEREVNRITRNRRREEDDGDDDSSSRENAGRRPNMTSQRRNSQSNNDSPTSNNNNNTHGHRRRNSAVENMGNFPTSNVELHMNSSDVWEALIAIREARMRQRNEREFHLDVERRDNQWMQRQNRNNVVSVNMPRASHTVVIVGDRRPQSHSRQGTQIMYAIPRNHRIHHNTPRLTHYIEEPNLGSGYIKELCFSSDGRLICSPFGNGIRLLAFSNQCQELSDCVPPSMESSQLVEVAASSSHEDIVVSSKFSPRHCLLVSGCLSGKITWYQPVV